jgi:hypothetical protein
MQDVQRFAQDLCQRVVNMLHLVELAGREVPVKDILGLGIMPLAQTDSLTQENGIIQRVVLEDLVALFYPDDDKPTGQLTNRSHNLSNCAELSMPIQGSELELPRDLLANLSPLIQSLMDARQNGPEQANVLLGHDERCYRDDATRLQDERAAFVQVEHKNVQAAFLVAFDT